MRRPVLVRRVEQGSIGVFPQPRRRGGEDRQRDLRAPSQADVLQRDNLRPLQRDDLYARAAHGDRRQVAALLAAVSGLPDGALQRGHKADLHARRQRRGREKVQGAARHDDDGPAEGAAGAGLLPPGQPGDLQHPVHGQRLHRHGRRRRLHADVDGVFVLALQLDPARGGERVRHGPLVPQRLRAVLSRGIVHAADAGKAVGKKKTEKKKGFEKKNE